MVDHDTGRSFTQISKIGTQLCCLGEFSQCINYHWKCGISDGRLS